MYTYKKEKKRNVASNKIVSSFETEVRSNTEL